MSSKKNVLVTVLVSSLALLGALGLYKSSDRIEQLQTELEQATLPAPSTQPKPDEPLLVTVRWMMDQPICRGRKADELSELRKVSLSTQIDRIVSKQGGTRKEQEVFVWLICKESQFHYAAKSPVGALGLTQMMVPTAQETATRLKMGKISPDDLFDPEISLTLGYNHFLHLSSMLNGNLAKVAASYNGGMAGATMKALKTGGLGAHETDNYVASAFNTMEELRIAKEKNSILIKN